MVFKFFDKKTWASKSVNEELAQDLHKIVIKTNLKNQVYARFKEHIWASDLAEMESLSSFNHGVKYLLYVINVLTKYAWTKLLKASFKF